MTSSSFGRDVHRVHKRLVTRTCRRPVRPIASARRWPTAAAPLAVPSSSWEPVPALLCTIGGEEVDLAKPGAARRADAAAARVPRPPPPGRSTQELPRPTPAPGGSYREYWIQARSIGWNIVPTGRDDWHGHKITGKTSFRAYVYQEMTAGFAEPKGGINMPGPTLYAEVGDVLVVHFRNARHQAPPGGHDAPARRPLHPRVRRRLPGQVHARRRVRRPRRGVHLLLGVHPGRRRRLALPRPRPQPHAQHVPRPVRRDRDQRARRQDPRRQLHADAAPADAADHRPQPRLPVHQRPRVRRATRRP